MAQWLRVCLPIQGTRVRAPVWEDRTCRGATGPVSHNYWACASGAVLRNERPRHWEARAPRWRVAPARRNWRKPSHRNEDPTQPKINKFIKKIYIGPWTKILWIPIWQIQRYLIPRHHPSSLEKPQKERTPFPTDWLIDYLFQQRFIYQGSGEGSTKLPLCVFLCQASEFHLVYLSVPNLRWVARSNLR